MFSTFCEKTRNSMFPIFRVNVSLNISSSIIHILNQNSKILNTLLRLPFIQLISFYCCFVIKSHLICKFRNVNVIKLFIKYKSSLTNIYL